MYKHQDFYNTIDQLEKQLRLDHHLAKKIQKELLEEHNRKKYIAKNGLLSSFEQVQKALNDMTEVELKAKHFLM